MYLTYCRRDVVWWTVGQVLKPTNSLGGNPALPATSCGFGKFLRPLWASASSWVMGVLRLDVRMRRVAKHIEQAWHRAGTLWRLVLSTIHWDRPNGMGEGGFQVKHEWWEVAGARPPGTCVVFWSLFWRHWGASEGFKYESDVRYFVFWGFWFYFETLPNLQKACWNYCTALSRFTNCYVLLHLLSLSLPLIFSFLCHTHMNTLLYIFYIYTYIFHEPFKNSDMIFRRTTSKYLVYLPKTRTQTHKTIYSSVIKFKNFILI